MDFPYKGPVMRHFHLLIFALIIAWTSCWTKCREIWDAMTPLLVTSLLWPGRCSYAETMCEHNGTFPHRMTIANQQNRAEFLVVNIFIFIVFQYWDGGGNWGHSCGKRDHTYTVRCRCNPVNFLKNIHIRHPTARARNGVSLVDPASDWYFAWVPSTIYAIS